MNIENLADMANRIGEFFSAYPNVDEAQCEIANHLRKFWEPRMRSALLYHVDQQDGARLNPLVLDAVRRFHDDLAPLHHAAP